VILIRGIPLYWGIEPDADDRSFITRATMEEALPPFRYSIWAFRIRVTHRHWLHLGVCKHKNTVTPWVRKSSAAEPGVGRSGINTVVAPANRGKLNALPRP